VSLLLASPSVLDPVTHAARVIAGLWWLLFAISLVVFAVVTMLVVLVVLRARGRRGPAAPPDAYAPESRGGLRLIVVGGVVVPAVVLFGLLVATVAALPATSPHEEGSAALTVEVTGRQWFWDVRYPASGVVTANEIHVPVGEDVELVALTRDVVHSFWAPQLNRKIDMIPGRRNRVLLHVDEPGVYRGQCAEFCGLQHARMAFEVVAEEPAAFERWLDGQRREAAAPSGSAARGLEVFADAGCSGCHRIAGTDAQGEVGPDLTHLASRRTIAAGTLLNDREQLARWIRNPQHVKPGNLMPGPLVSEDDLQPLLDYLETLR
jgi:cytochrome c oxidase subunit 2